MQKKSLTFFFLYFFEKKEPTAVYQFQSHRIGGMQIVNDHLFVKDNQDWKVVNTSNTKYAVIFDN